MLWGRDLGLTASSTAGASRVLFDVVSIGSMEEGFFTHPKIILKARTDRGPGVCVCLYVCACVYVCVYVCVCVRTCKC